MKAPTDEKTIRFGKFTLDLDRRGLFCSTERVRLTPKPYEVLVYLALAKGRIVSKAELLRTVWDGHQNENVVEQAINQIRRAIGEDKNSPLFIQTIPSQGYCFLGEKADSEAAPVPSLSPPTGPSRRQILMLAGAGAAGLGATAFLLFPHHQNPHAAEVHGRVLTAFDASGKTLWTFELAGKVRQPGAELFPKTNIAVVDLDGHGRNSILAWAWYTPAASEGVRHELICLDWRGRVRWRMRPNPPLLDYDGKPFARDWNIGGFLTIDTGGPPTIWCSVTHEERFASCLLRIQPDGQQTVQFWPRGFVDRICAFPRGDKLMLALGGIDNSINLPFVAIIEAFGQPVCAPLGRADNFRFAFANAPSNIAREVILLPDVETNRFYDAPYFSIGLIEYRDPVLMIRSEQNRDQQHYRFEFSTDLRPIKVRLQSGYKLVHENMENRGIVDHSYDQCPERLNGMQILRWTGTGWASESIQLSE